MNNISLEQLERARARVFISYANQRIDLDTLLVELKNIKYLTNELATKQSPQTEAQRKGALKIETMRKYNEGEIHVLECLHRLRWIDSNLLS